MSDVPLGRSGKLDDPDEPTRRTIHKSFPAYRLRNDPLAALARAVSHRRRTIDQIDEKVIEHAQEYGFVTNRTLQRLFDRDLYASRNLLNDLRDRGIAREAWHCARRARSEVRAGAEVP
jgi:hypothetical protein